jgi:hypothetical protein
VDRVARGSWIVVVVVVTRVVVGVGLNKTSSSSE